MIIEDEKVPINVEVKNDLGIPIDVTMSVIKEYIDKDVERKTERVTSRHSQKKISVEIDPSYSKFPECSECGSHIYRPEAHYCMFCGEEINWDKVGIEEEAKIG